MNRKDDITPIIQFHHGIGGFNYDRVVDWAISLMERGENTDNIFMLASFKKPVDSVEIKPYLSSVLDDLGLEEGINEKTLHGYIHYYIDKILKGDNVRENLKILKELYVNEEFHYNRYLNHGLYPFSALYWAWCDVENNNYSYDYEDATKDNIKDLVQKEATKWINEYIHGIKVDNQELKSFKVSVKSKKRKDSLSTKLKKLFTK